MNVSFQDLGFTGSADATIRVWSIPQASCSHIIKVWMLKSFYFFFLLSVLTLYNDQVQSFPSILNTSFLFTLVFQAHDQAVTGLSLHATGNLILNTMLTLMLILSLKLYFYKSACTRSSIGICTPARCPNWPVFSFQIVFCLLMKQRKNLIWNYLICTPYLGDHFLHSYMARMFIELVAV